MRIRKTLLGESDSPSVSNVFLDHGLSSLSPELSMEVAAVESSVGDLGAKLNSSLCNFQVW